MGPQHVPTNPQRVTDDIPGGMLGLTLPCLAVPAPPRLTAPCMAV